MGKRHRNLFDSIIARENLDDAYRKAAKGRRGSGGYLNFHEYEGVNLKRLREQLGDRSYAHGEPRLFTVLEPKPRLIAALPFEDRIVQHALNTVIAPIFEAGMSPQSYACRVGRGTHAGAVKAQSLMRHMSRDGTVYCLKTDYRAYFNSVQMAPLWSRILAKVSCRAALWLIERFLPREGAGLKIGWLSSQLMANVYGTGPDRYLAQEERHGRFIRYMDDVVMFSHDINYLHELRKRLAEYSEATLGLTFSKWSVRPVSQGVNFLGYRIWPTHKLLRKDSVRRAKQKIRVHTESGDNVSLRHFLASWGGHVQWADGHNLMCYLAGYHQSLKEQHHVLA